MIDVLGEGLHAVALRSPLAYPLVFAAGIVTSVGPCVAPRYVAVTALANAARHPWRVIAAFVAGLIGAYVALGLAAGALGGLWSTSSAVYVALAVALGIGGSITLFRANAQAHEHTHLHPLGHEAAAATRTSASLGGTLLLGAASAFVVAPCCTPVVAGIAGLTIVGGRTLDGVLLLVVFALGHVLPLLAAGMLGRRVAGLVGRCTASAAPGVVAGTLMLALAAYYGVLA